MDKQFRPAAALALAAMLAGCGTDATINEPAASPLVPSAAKAAPPSSTTSWNVNGCEFTVTYTWSGFHGRNLTATFGVYERLGQFDGSVVLQNESGQLGKSGTATHTFSLAAGGPVRSLLARGSLLDAKNHQVSGSVSGTGTISSSCQ